MGEGSAVPEKRLPAGANTAKPPGHGPGEMAACTRVPAKQQAVSSHTPRACLSLEPRSWQPSLP